MQYISNADNVISQRVAVCDGQVDAVVLPANAAPGQKVVIIPSGSACDVQAASVNGVGGGKPCFTGRVTISVTDGGTGYSIGQKVTVENQNGASEDATIGDVDDVDGMILAVDAVLTNKFAQGDQLTVVCDSGDANAEAEASLTNPNAAVRCIHTDGGRWVCTSVDSDGTRRGL